MSKHTPGPWIAGDDEDSDLFLVGPETYPGLVTRAVVKLHNEANARLIAAAPELLEALEYLCSITEQPPLKNCKCHINPPCSDCVDYGALREALEDATKAISKAKGE